MSFTSPDFGLDVPRSQWDSLWTPPGFSDITEEVDELIIAETIKAVEESTEK